MVSAELVVCTLGHLASVDELRERGVPARAVRDALARGALSRVARGRYGCRHLGEMSGAGDQLAAARAHGRIGCLSALRRANVWAGVDPRLHLQLRPGQHGTGRDLVDSRGRPIVYHWSEPFSGANSLSPSARPARARPAIGMEAGPTADWHAMRLAGAPRLAASPGLVAFPQLAAVPRLAAAPRFAAAPQLIGDHPPTGSPGRPPDSGDDLSRFASGRCWLVEPMEAVWRAIHCLDEENAIACLESAVHEGFISAEQLWEICAIAPEHLQAGIAEIEFTADSGQETLVRRRLRRAGFRVVAQETPRGFPAEDLVVEDCVALETDGKKWHGPDRFQADRDRDLLYEGLGRRVLRLTQRHILHDWESTFLVITRVVEDAQREQLRRQGRPL